MDKYLKSKNKTQINNSINNKFDFSNEFPIDSCVNQEKSVLSDIQTKDLDKLDSCLNHIQNNIEILPQISNFNKYEEVFIDIKNSLLHADSIEVFNQIYEKLDKIINKMKKLVEQADAGILQHLDQLDINFMDFAYRWVSCYLTREFNIF